jgi:hypothetical protein
MIVEDLSQVNNKDFFAIIIGSGPAGLATALELEKKNIYSIIIEAGSLKYNTKATEFLRGDVIGDEYGEISGSRLRQFGGSSGHWGGWCNPLNKKDFASWPIKKNDLDPYLNSAKEILSLNNDFFNEKFSNNLNSFNLIQSSEPKLGDKYYSHIKKSKYIYLSLNTIFVNFKGENGNIIAANCYKNKYHNLKAKFYILSCGGIENSRLLLWAKNVNPNLFNFNLPIGNYYMDHPYQGVAEGLIISKKLFNYYNKNNLSNKPILSCSNQINLSFNHSFLKNRNILNSGMYVIFQKADINSSFLKKLICVAPKYVKTFIDNSTLEDSYQISVYLIQEQEALFSNKIKLGKKLDPLKVPLPEIHWKKSKLLRDSAKTLSEEFASILIDSEIGRMAISEHLFDDSPYKPLTGNHQLGGTRMGQSSENSVVDKNLKVHGFENLFINGSSVFSTSGHAHPTLTIVQLALRLSQHLSKKII